MLFFSDKKGISPLIASVLLIAFTMAVAGLFSSWAPELLQSVQSDTSDDTSDLLKATNAGLGVDSAVFDSDSGNTSVVFRNTGQTELNNFTVTARLSDGGFVQKQVDQSLDSAGIVNVELNTTDAPNLVRVDSEGLDVSAQTESVSGASGDGGSGSVDFVLSGVSDNGPVTEGSTVSVDYTVSNNGDVSGSQDITLDVNGVQEDVDSGVSLGSGGSSSGSLSWSTSSGDAGSYSYSVSTENDSVSGTVDVNALSGPSAVASDNVSQPEAGETIEFDGSGSTSGDGSIIGYDWDVNGDGSYEKSGEVVTYSYSSSGVKSVELNVSDDNGLYSTDSLSVDVQPAPVSAPSVGGSWSHVKPAGSEGGYDYFFDSSTTPYGTTYSGNSSVQYTSDGFFVMKYQASENGSDPGVPQSVSDKAGWNSISFNDAGGTPNAYDACENLDSQTNSYDVHLMTNREWMTVARQVAQDSSNWADNTVGSTGSSGGLYQGNHDEASVLDRAVDLSSSDYPSGGDYPNAASVGNATSDEVRTHSLASGDSVWDLSGDLRMWVDAEEDGTTMSTNSSKLYEKNALNSTVSGGDGLGGDYGFDNSDAALRGGPWGNGDYAGVFNAYSDYPGNPNSDYGFRCSAVPVS